MQIVKADIGFSSQHSALEVNALQTESLVGDQRQLNVQLSEQDVVSLSSVANATDLQTPAVKTSADTKSDDVLGEEDTRLNAKLYQLKRLVESLTGKEITLEEIDIGESPQQNVASVEQSAQFEAPLLSQTQIQYEFERSDFAATGSITTADGQVINFDIAQTLSREFFQISRVSVNSPDPELKDPLLINLKGGNIELTDERVSFDIDADGAQDSVFFATGNSGFIALDRNENGKIDDGSELFGALTGNGFAELAQFDEDGNGFIDSGDSVFLDLSVLQIDNSGNAQQANLAGLGIGALYLGSQSTPFELTDEENNLKAVVRSSGIYVAEQGSAGTLNQIDLVV